MSPVATNLRAWAQKNVTDPVDAQLLATVADHIDHLKRHAVTKEEIDARVEEALALLAVVDADPPKKACPYAEAGTCLGESCGACHGSGRTTCEPRDEPYRAVRRVILRRMLVGGDVPSDSGRDG